VRIPDLRPIPKLPDRADVVDDPGGPPDQLAAVPHRAADAAAIEPLIQDVELVTTGNNPQSIGFEDAVDAKPHGRDRRGRGGVDAPGDGVRLGKLLADYLAVTPPQRGV
jgi:RimJ/RimL family protein N-acetyltransferase